MVGHMTKANEMAGLRTGTFSRYSFILERIRRRTKNFNGY